MTHQHRTPRPCEVCEPWSPAERHLSAQLNWLAARTDELQTTIDRTDRKETAIMSEMTNLTDAVTANTTVDQSALTLIQGLHDQLVAAIAAGDPAALQSLADQLNTSSTDLAAAITANTPAAPAAPPA